MPQPLTETAEWLIGADACNVNNIMVYKRIGDQVIPIAFVLNNDKETAKLIAAAPAMYTALAQLVKLMNTAEIQADLGDETDRVFPNWEFNDARAALAKVEEE